MEAPDCTHKLTESWQNGSCCCNCKWHHEDFYHCCTPYPRKSLRDRTPEGCRCGIHKGWICMVSIDGEDSRAHSGWSNHGMCEMHVRKEI